MEIELLPFGQSLSDRQRAAHYKWLNMPSGLTPELASKFMLGLHGGKTIRDMTTAGGKDYICSDARFQKHRELNPEWWGDEEQRLNEANANFKKRYNNKNKNKTHCKHGHDLAIHGKLTIQKGGWKWRRCTLCTQMHQRGGGVIRPEAVEKVKEHLHAGGKIAEILNGIMRPPVWNLLRQRDPSIDLLVAETAPLRARVALGWVRGSRGGVSHTAEYRKQKYLERHGGKLILRGPTLTGIIAGRPDPVFDAVNAAVGFRHDRDIRMEAISLTTLDYLEGRIEMEGITAAARRHLGALYSQKKYTRSVDEPRYRDGSGDVAWIETIVEGIW